MIFNRREQSVNRYFVGDMSADEIQAFLAAVEQDQKLKQMFDREERIQSVLVRDRDAVPSAQEVPEALNALMDADRPASGIPGGIGPAMLEPDTGKSVRRRYLGIFLGAILLLGALVLWLASPRSTEEEGSRKSPAPPVAAAPALTATAGTLVAGTAVLTDTVRRVREDNVPRTPAAAHAASAARSDKIDTGRRSHARHARDQGDARFLKDYLRDGSRHQAPVRTDSTVHMRIRR
ncbi:MAG TPA: hypothetical protein VHI13_16060 [Candidatus Kapabacteria bacterium]|nr:hypothetical protein [Candidatus Kapabacteria bacterium]